MTAPDDETGTVLCPNCKRRVPLQADGTVSPHLYAPDVRSRCPGSDYRPAAGRGDTDDSGDACPIACDDDCEQVCHSVHHPWGKKDHLPEHCPAEPPGELREQVAAELFSAVLAEHDAGTKADPEMWGRLADALLSGPLAPLLAAEAAVKRVEELLPRIEGVIEFDMAGERYDAVTSVQQVLEHLRRALDGGAE